MNNTVAYIPTFEQECQEALLEESALIVAGNVQSMKRLINGELDTMMSEAGIDTESKKEYFITELLKRRERGKSHRAD